MILKLDKDIVTRYQVERLAADNPGVTEIDWNGHEAYSVSAIDEMLRRFPNVVHIGASNYTKSELAWVTHQLGLDDPD
jgi:hypothetical protein